MAGVLASVNRTTEVIEVKMIETGTLALVVGPSGAGKDTLIAAARDALARDQRFLFCRRIVTHTAIAAVEDHDSMANAAFIDAEQAGRFFLSWHAHGLRYALPMTMTDALRDDRIVIANVSRAVIDAAEARAAHVVVYSVTAPPEVLAKRLAKHGRESTEVAAARLRRSVDVTTRRAHVIEIDNAGAMAIAADALIMSLVSLTSRRNEAESAR